MGHTMIERTCGVCGVKFMIRQTYLRIGGGKYCSQKCGAIGRSQKIPVNCRNCGSEFLVSPSKMKAHDVGYCSRACQKEHTIKKRVLICQYCGKEFLKNGRDPKYCSRKCSGLSHRNTVEKVCEICSKTYRVHASASESKYCSRGCANKGLVKASNQQCIVCGKVFSSQPYKARYSKKGGLFCSRKCSFAYHRGDKHVYWKGGLRHYRGPNWPIQRELAYERDGGTCQLCGRKHKVGERKFDVHHIKGFREFDSYLEANRLENLIVLCRKCHRTIENGDADCPKHLL